MKYVGKMTDSIPLDLTSLPTDLTCNQEELDRWLDSSPPLSDDEIKAMSAYFHSESFQLPDNNLCDLISIDKQNNVQQMGQVCSTSISI